MDALGNTIANHKLEPMKTMSLFDGISSISRLPTGTNARYSDAVLKQYSHLWFFFPFDSRFGGNSDVFFDRFNPNSSDDLLKKASWACKRRFRVL